MIPAMTMGWLESNLPWQNALVVIPLALGVAAICRVTPCRPATRHMLWLVVLAVLVASPLLPALWAPPAAGQTPVPKRLASADAVRLPAPSALSRPPGPVPEPPVFHRTLVRTPLTSLSRAMPRWGLGPPALPATAEPSGPEAAPALQAKIGRTQTAAIGGSTDTDPGNPGAGDPVLPRVRDVSATQVPDSGSALRQQWRHWLAKLNVVREAVMDLPPMPLTVWAGGVVVLLLIGARRISRSRAIVRAARPAGASVERIVAAASRQLGLGCPPATRVIDEPISPMLICGRRVWLILPAALWAELDDAGRWAVVYHELAHLRRRDHWVCWAQMLIGLLYWWHPVVWWIRRRLREEADLCCDAWVTSLLPGDRRAYALALLEARSHTSIVASRKRPAVPSVGLGASTIRARRFARRLTMVMTAQTSPRLSIRGVALAATLAAGGYLVTPIFACPPSPKEPAATSAARWAPKAPKAPRAPKAPKAPKAPVFAVPGLPGDVTTFERFMQDRGRGESGTMSLEQRIEELQRQIDRLREQLQRLSQARLGLTFSPGVGPSGGIQISPSRVLAQAAELQAKRIKGLSLAYAAPVIQAKPVDALSLAYAAVAVGSGGGEVSLDNCLQKAALSRGPVVARSYELDQGKLEALGELMVRNDVPIRVRVSGDSIEVHATEQQHCVFEAFVAMIDGKETVKAYRLPEGKLKALNELMVRSDVPIFVQPGPEQIKVRGNPLEQAVFGAMVQMINPASTPARTAVQNLVGTYERALQYEAKAAEQVSGLRKLRASLRSLEGQVRSIQRQSDRSAERAVRLQDKGDQLQEQSEELREEAEDLDGRRRDARLKRAESLIVRAQECFQEAEALRIQADELQARSEDLEDAVEELQDRVEELEELEEEADEAYD